MTSENHGVDATLSINPFPATAVAVLTDPTSRQSFTVRTDAVRQVEGFVEDYLRRSKLPHLEDAHIGATIAIIGEYGTGKTHIGFDVLERVRSESDATTHAYYLDAPADTFVALYRDRFVPLLHRSDVRGQVRELFVGLLSERLGRSSITSPAVSAIHSRDTDPFEYAQFLGIIDTDLREQLRQTLSAVTEREDFAIALTLFSRPEFEEVVWEWICGNPPDPVLGERGITQALDTEALALEALGVFSLLFGRPGHRFVLLIDEVEKIHTIAGARSANQSTVAAFKRLLESIGRTRSLLLLVGLPDFFESLPTDVRQRMTAQIHPGPMSSREIADYILNCNQAANQVRSKAPFTDDSIEYMAELTGGNASRIVRLCYLAFHHSAVTGNDVSRAGLREITRDQFESHSQFDAEREIVRVFDSNGWRFLQDEIPVFGAEPVDYWLPVGNDGGGLILMLSRSILYSEDVSRLVSPVRSRKNTTEPVAFAILVVNGFLAENLRSMVLEHFDRVVHLGGRNFDDELENVARGMRQRLEEANRADQISSIHDRVDQIARQLSYVSDKIELLDDVSSQVSSIDLAVARALRSILLNGVLPQRRSEVEHIFWAAFAVLDTATQTVEEHHARSGAKAKPRIDAVVQDLAMIRRELVLALEAALSLPEHEALRRVEVVCREADRSASKWSSALGARATDLLEPSGPLFEIGYRVWTEVRNVLERRSSL